MIDTTVMGPGFLVFFQHNGITSGGYEPQIAYKGHPWAYRPEEKKALGVIEDIAKKVVRAPLTASHKVSKDDLELMLRLKLQAKDMAFEVKYLKLLVELQQFHRQQEEIFLLLLH